MQQACGTAGSVPEGQCHRHAALLAVGVQRTSVTCRYMPLHVLLAVGVRRTSVREIRSASRTGYHTRPLPPPRRKCPLCARKGIILVMIKAWESGL